MITAFDSTRSRFGPISRSKRAIAVRPLQPASQLGERLPVSRSDRRSCGTPATSPGVVHLRISLVHELRGRMQASIAQRRTSGQGTVGWWAGRRPRAQRFRSAIATLPAFTFSGYTGFSGNARRWAMAESQRVRVTDSVTWIRAAHPANSAGEAAATSCSPTRAPTDFGFTGVMTQNPARLPVAATRSPISARLPRQLRPFEPGHGWGGYGPTGTASSGRPERQLIDHQPGVYEFTPWLTGYRNQAAAFDPTRAKSIMSRRDRYDRFEPQRGRRRLCPVR